MKQFSYKILTIDRSIFDLEKKINEYGKNGWELIAVQDFKLFFKKEIYELNM